MNIDPDKIIPINDCQGTCKTPVGCTCGKMEEDKIIEVEAKTSFTLDVNELEQALDADDSGEKVCTCGKNPGGMCGCKTNGVGSCSCGTKRSGGCCEGKNKLEVYDWLGSMPNLGVDFDMVEVQFKNTRKDYYLNSNNIKLEPGDIVAVEASPGHDIGEVTLTGNLVRLQMAKNKYRGESKRVYRIAKSSDIEKAEEARQKEHKTMLRAREIAEELQLGMKISDVEYQGDGNKAIFYYIADQRVDFRQLIKVYASEFRVKIEMRQIGARQEAGRVGGIGPCGRELCCSSSMTNFVSVSTAAARLQDIPLNPQKLAGQCSKLKCCLNYEVDMYIEAQKKLPSREITLETKDSTYYHFKSDILSGEMTYSTDKRFAVNLVSLPSTRVHDIIRMNKRGEKPLTLLDMEAAMVEATPSSKDILDQDSINRFDNSERERRGRSNSRSRGNRNRRKNEPQDVNEPQEENGSKKEKSDNQTQEGKRPNRVRRPNNKQGREQNPENKTEGQKNPNQRRKRNFKRNRPAGNAGNNNAEKE